MRLLQELLELVDLRPHDVDPAVADPLVRVQRERPAAQHEDVLLSLQAHSIEQRQLHLGRAHRWPK